MIFHKDTKRECYKDYERIFFNKNIHNQGLMA